MLNESDSQKILRELARAADKLERDLPFMDREDITCAVNDLDVLMDELHKMYTWRLS